MKNRTERLFFGIPLNEDIKTIVEDVRKQMRSIFKFSDVSWVSNDNLHITLHFLGDVEVETMEKFIEKVHQTVLPKPFELKLLVTTAIPHKKNPKILIIDTSFHPSLMGIYKRLGDVIVGLGVEVDERPYRPHITVGRVRARAEVFQPEKIIMPELKFEVNNVILYKSTITPLGSIYEIIEKFSL